MNIIKNKAAVIGFSYFCGILAANSVGIFPAAAIIAALVFGLLRKSPAVTLMLFSVGIGALSFSIYDHTQRQPVFDAAGETLTLTGTVEDRRELAFYQVNYTIKTEINGVTARVMITAPDSLEVGVGDVVKTTAILHEFRDSAVFPERSYNLTRGILLKGNADEVLLVTQGGKTPVGYIQDYNEYIRGRVISAFPDSELNIGGLLCAVFLGDKSQLSAESAENIKISGVAHFTAVSGLHMTMITHMLMLFFALIPRRVSRRTRFALLLSTVVTLAVFFNLTVSVTRAALMLIIFYGGELFMRRGAVINSMGFALLIILLGSPYAAFDAGLLMSFSGTFGVGVVAPAIIGKRNINPVANALIVSTCAAVCVLPIAALFFGGISILAPLVSVIILPFFVITAGAMTLFALTGGYISAFLLAAGIMSRIMNEIIAFFGRFEAAWISLEYWFMPFWIALAIIAVFAIRVIYKNDLKAIKAACITVATLALMICVYNASMTTCERTYITIYSDSVAATATVRRGNTEFVIVSNALPEQGDYDISGKFMFTVGENEAILHAGDFSMLFTRASNDNATPANITVASGWVREKRSFHCQYVVYVSRSIATESGELNAYFEPVYLMLKGDSS